MSHYNLNNKGRFEILMDKTHTLNRECMSQNPSDGTQFSTHAVAKHFKRYFKCNTPIEYTSSTGAIGEQTTNNYGLLIISRRGHAYTQVRARLRFTD